MQNLATNKIEQDRINEQKRAYKNAKHLLKLKQQQIALGIIEDTPDAQPIESRTKLSTRIKRFIRANGEALQNQLN